MIVNPFLLSMLIPIPPEYFDRVFLYMTYYMTALISPASLLFTNIWIFYGLSFLFFSICLMAMVLRFEYEDAIVQVALSFIPILNLIPMIRIPDWPVGSVVLLIPSLSAIAVSQFYTHNSEKFTDIYYDIYIISVFIFIVIFATLWTHISYALRRPRWLGILVMIPFINVIMLMIFAFGKTRPIFRHPELARIHEDPMPRLR
jgi:hypothetical protein